MEQSFDRPIPGMCITFEVGSRPWQTPPEITTVEQATNYYVERMNTDQFKAQLVDVIEMGVPLATLANTIQLASVMEGVHSVDVGMLVMPVIMELIMYIAEEQGVKYTIGLEKDKKLRSTLIESALVRLEEETNNQEEPVVESENKIETTEVEEVSKDIRKGLMGRS